MILRYRYPDDSLHDAKGEFGGICPASPADRTRPRACPIKGTLESAVRCPLRNTKPHQDHVPVFEPVIAGADRDAESHAGGRPDQSWLTAGDLGAWWLF